MTSLKKSKNANQNLAKAAKKDEFYTQLDDIARELKHYKKHLKGKVVFCNCDDPEESNFWKYFEKNFEFLGLKRLISTHYVPKGPSFKLEIIETRKSPRVVRTPLEGNGDFRSEECVDLLEQADIIVTNPPFSLFREYVAQLAEHGKKFIIIGHQNAIAYKDIFPLIKDNKLWLGFGFQGGAAHFINKHYKDYASATDHKDGMIRVSGVQWFTNLDTAKRHEDLILYKTYTPKEYPTYDNYDAIEVSKTGNIPMDYSKVMGVPVTFLEKYNPDQFELLGSNRGIDQDPNGVYGRGSMLNGKETYKRLFIKRKVKKAGA
jgi:hypothetical protein